MPCVCPEITQKTPKFAWKCDFQSMNETNPTEHITPLCIAQQARYQLDHQSQTVSWPLGTGEEGCLPDSWLVSTYFVWKYISSKNRCSASLFCIREHWESQDEVLPCSFAPICHSNCLFFNCPKASDKKLCEQSGWDWLKWPSMAKYPWKSRDKIRCKEYLSLF